MSTIRGEAPPASTRPVEPPAALDPAVRSLVAEITGHAWAWWSGQHATQSWAALYMAGRGLADAEWGVAPASWTGLTDHLQALGYTADQLIAAGVTTRTRNGRPIDRFRHRIIFPVRDQAGVIVGVTARINPAETDHRAPKYLNTPETAAYRKSELLLGLDPAAIARLAGGAQPVLVEGPTDHAALQLAASDLAERTGIEIVAVAACGTGISRRHLQALRDATGRGLTDLIVALDPDTAGRTAVARVWDMLTPDEATQARALDLPTGTDPAQAAIDTPDTLATALAETIPLSWFAMEPNLQHIRDLDHFERQIPLLRALVDHLHGRIEPAQWPALVEHVAQVVGAVDTTSRERLSTGDVRRVMVEHYADGLLNQTETQPQRTAAPASDVSGADSNQEQAQSDPHVRAWLTRQADLLSTRLDRLVDQALLEPELWMENIAPPPPPGAERKAWAAALRQVLAYRDRYQITDSTDPLGPNVEGERGEARMVAARALQTITQAESDRSTPTAPLRPRRMERVPTVLAEARSRGEYLRRQAEERVQRDQADRQRAHEASRGW